METDERGKILTAKRIILFWVITTQWVIGMISLGYVPELSLDPLYNVYWVFTVASHFMAATLWGYDTFGLPLISKLGVTK